MKPIENNPGAVVLVSGGIDSAACLGIACQEYETVVPIHLYYGQQTGPMEREMASRQVTHFSQMYEGETEVRGLNILDYTGIFSHFPDGVADPDKEFGHLVEDDGRSSGYVPMRNLHLIATGAGVADYTGAQAVYIGVQAGDEPDYPDCRWQFIAAAQNAVNNSIPDGQEILVASPLQNMSKVEVIRYADELGVDFRWTYSCYAGADERGFAGPCGDCPACHERIEAFNEADIEDPHMPNQ